MEQLPVSAITTADIQIGQSLIVKDNGNTRLWYYRTWLHMAFTPFKFVNCIFLMVAAATATAAIKTVGG